MSETIATDIYEVKGYGNHWEVWYPDEGDIPTPHIWYDKEGKVKSVIWAGGDSGKLTKSFCEFETGKEAINYAQELGAENIKLIKSKPKKKKKEDSL